MSKSVIQLISELVPPRAGYAHLSVESERDLSEALMPIRADLGALLEAYDAIQKERDDAEEELERLDLSSSYKDAETRQDMLDGWTEREAYIAGRLVHLLRKEA